MKGKLPRLIFPMAALLITGSGFAQQTNADAGFLAPVPKKAKLKAERAVEEKPAAYDITGVVQQAFKMKHPLQLVNPLAPKKDGSGHEDIAWDPDNPEKPKGIIIFGIQW